MITLADNRKRQNMAFILKSIAHPVRIGIVELLTHHDKLSVNEICKKIDCEQSLISHHLASMRLKGILSHSREGKNVYYALKMKEVTKVIECIEDCNVDRLMPELFRLQSTNNFKTINR